MFEAITMFLVDLYSCVTTVVMNNKFFVTV